MEPLSLINLIITLCLMVGGVAAYRHGFTRTANEVQERVINALQSEIQSLHDRIAALVVNRSSCYTVLTEEISIKVNTGMKCIFSLKNSRLFSVLV